MTEGKKENRAGVIVLGIVYGVAVLSLILNRVFHIRGETTLAAAEALTFSIFIVAVSIGAVGTGLLMLVYIAQIRANNMSLLEDFRRLISGQKNTEAILTQISESLLLSDAIKSVAFRENDKSVLMEAIKQDIQRGMWESAELLLGELERRFGRRQESMQLRDQLSHSRNVSLQEKLEGGIKNIKSLWMIHRYEEAQKEVDKLLQLYPNNEEVQKLKGQTEQRRKEQKRRLMERWDAAVKNNDVEQGVEILKLLDDYLTSEEAAVLEESARGIFRAKLHNMGVQFSLFVTEKKWSQALKVGNQIVTEFPNSQMAQEVREKIDILKQRAQHLSSGQSE